MQAFVSFYSVLPPFHRIIDQIYIPIHLKILAWNDFYFRWFGGGLFRHPWHKMTLNKRANFFGLNPQLLLFETIVNLYFGCNVIWFQRYVIHAWASGAGNRECRRIPSPNCDIRGNPTQKIRKNALKLSYPMYSRFTQLANYISILLPFLHNLQMISKKPTRTKKSKLVKLITNIISMSSQSPTIWS